MATLYNIIRSAFSKRHAAAILFGRSSNRINQNPSVLQVLGVVSSTFIVYSVYKSNHTLEATKLKPVSYLTYQPAAYFSFQWYISECKVIQCWYESIFGFVMGYENKTVFSRDFFKFNRFPIRCNFFQLVLITFIAVVKNQCSFNSF